MPLVDLLSVMADSALVLQQQEQQQQEQQEQQLATSPTPPTAATPAVASAAAAAAAVQPPASSDGENKEMTDEAKNTSTTTVVAATAAVATGNSTAVLSSSPPTPLVSSASFPPPSAPLPPSRNPPSNRSVVAPRVPQPSLIVATPSSIVVPSWSAPNATTAARPTPSHPLTSAAPSDSIKLFPHKSTLKKSSVVESKLISMARVVEPTMLAGANNTATSVAAANTIVAAVATNHGHNHRSQIRVKLACSNCKASKTKCDDERPCRRCVRTDRSHTCVDSERNTMDSSSSSDDEPTPPHPSHLMTHAQITQQQQFNRQHQQQLHLQQIQQQHMSAIHGAPFIMFPNTQLSSYSPPMQLAAPMYPPSHLPPHMHATHYAPFNNNSFAPPFTTPSPLIATATLFPTTSAVSPSPSATASQTADQPTQQKKKKKQEDSTIALANELVRSSGNSNTTSLVDTDNSTKPSLPDTAMTSTDIPHTQPPPPPPAEPLHIASATVSGAPSPVSASAASSAASTPTSTSPHTSTLIPASTSPPSLLPAAAPPAAPPAAASAAAPAAAAPPARRSASTRSKFCSPQTPEGHAYLETLIMAALPHLHIWQQKMRQMEEQEELKNQNNAADTNTSSSAMTLKRRRVDWLQSFFRFMHSGGNTPDEVDLPDLAGTLAVPKHLYGSLQLGVLLFPLGAGDFAHYSKAWINLALAQMLGYSNVEELQSILTGFDGVGAVNHPLNLFQYMPKFIDCVLTGTPNFSVQSKWRHAAGHYVEMIESINLSFHEDGHVIYVASLMQVVNANASPPQQRRSIFQPQIQQTTVNAPTAPFNAMPFPAYANLPLPPPAPSSFYFSAPPPLSVPLPLSSSSSLAPSLSSTPMGLFNPSSAYALPLSFPPAASNGDNTHQQHAVAGQNNIAAHAHTPRTQ